MTNNNTDVFNAFFKELSCRIYILGHYTQGESILFLLYGDHKIIYSCVVDSFRVDNKVIPQEFLNRLGLSSITDLFWTHPHDDHSEGLIDIVDAFHPKHIYIPDELLTLPDTIKTNSAEVLKKINTYRGYDERVVNPIKVQPIGINKILYRKKLSVNEYKIPFEIFTVAPCSGKIRQNIIGDVYSSLNDYSIVLAITIGDFSILLTGDIPNSMINYVIDDLAQEVATPNILKIPHHGSKTSTSITNLFIDDCVVDFAVTTAKRSSKLPTETALKHYNSKCQKVYRIKSPSDDIAVWSVEVNILDASIKPLIMQNIEEYSG